MPHLSFRRICAAACGIVVTTDDNEVVQVRGGAERLTAMLGTPPRDTPGTRLTGVTADQPRT